MKRVFWILLPLSLLAFLWLWLSIGSHQEPTVQPQKSDGEQASSQSQEDPSSTPPIKEDTRLNRLPDGKVEFKPAIQISRSIHSMDTIEGSLAQIEALLGQYRFAFGENPVGVENFEITEQLLGKNPKNVVFIDSESSALRGNELVDQWGTPYFFHPISGQKIEIRTAGPDRTLWTNDDVQIGFD